MSDHVIAAGDIVLEGRDPYDVTGHFSDLFIGTHKGDRKVALKRLRIGNRTSGGEKMEKLEREAAIWRPLQHPHILPFMGIYRENDYLYLVSPFMDNGNLADYISHHPNCNRTSLLRETADAVAYLHFEGIVHGDIKARNILVSGSHSAALCDFGLSKFAPSVTASASKGQGSARWLSPELLSGESRCYASDTYAFGITIAEVLSGATPYPHLQIESAVIVAVLAAERPTRFPPHSLVGESYETAWSTATQCWAEDPESRPTMDVVRSLFRATYPTTSPLCHDQVPDLSPDTSYDQILTSTSRTEPPPRPRIETSSSSPADSTATGSMISTAIQNRDNEPTSPVAESFVAVTEGSENSDSPMNDSSSAMVLGQELVPGSTAAESSTSAGGWIPPSITSLFSSFRVSSSRSPTPPPLVEIPPAEDSGVPSYQYLDQVPIEPFEHVGLDAFDEPNRRQPVKILPPTEQEATRPNSRTSPSLWGSSYDNALCDWTPFLPTGSRTSGIIKNQSQPTRDLFSDVWKSEIPSLSKDTIMVALKVLRHHVVQKHDPVKVRERMNSRWYQEVNIWAGLNHPYIVPFIGAISSPIHALILPWHSHGNLSDYLRRYPSVNRLNLISDVARGLQHLHNNAAPIVHGDIKPESVLINDQGVALVTDFAMATIVNKDDQWYTPTHRYGGTDQWMAPEVLLPVDLHGERSQTEDVYSFRRLTFYVMTDRKPHGSLSVEKNGRVRARYPLRNPRVHGTRLLTNLFYCRVAASLQDQVGRRSTVPAFTETLAETANVFPRLRLHLSLSVFSFICSLWFVPYGITLPQGLSHP